MSRLKKVGIGATSAGVLAVATIGSYEGLRTKAYHDIIGVPTVCYGETKGVHMGDVYTKEKCASMFVERLDEFAARVEKCVEKPMSDKTEVAFVSLAYNIGWGGFCRSHVVRLYNDGQLREACDAMLAFNRAGGRPVTALTHRRQAERKLCLEGLG